MLKWLKRLRRSKDLYVSQDWLIEQSQQESIEGWVGPRWRFPAERVEQNRIERRRRISLVRSKDIEAKENRA